MKFNKNLLFVIFIAATISTVSFAMDDDGFTPVLSRKAKRQAKHAAPAAPTDAPPVAPRLSRAARRAAAAQQSADAVNKAADVSKDDSGSILSSAKPAPAGVSADSFVAKMKRNNLKAFAVIFALAEAADFAQAFFLKTTKEELQDKTLVQKAKLIAQKTYTAALLGVAKDGLMNKVVPGILDLKHKAQDYLNKKKQTA